MAYILGRSPKPWHILFPPKLQAQEAREFLATAASRQFAGPWAGEKNVITNRLSRFAVTGYSVSSQSDFYLTNAVANETLVSA